jgi:SAM-dependent methyltransferase
MIERENNPADAHARPDTADLVHDVVLSLLRSEKAGCLLDVPAGEGAFAAHAKELGCEVYCGDIVPDRFRVPGLTCDRVDLNQRWPYPSDKFDYVTSIEAIEHLENPWHMIREVARVLRMGGKLFLSTPNILSIKSRISILLYGYPNYFTAMVNHDPGTNKELKELPVDHINPVSFFELRHILARNGFLIERVETNRCLKKRSLLYQLLRLLLQTRGRSQVLHNMARARVRELVLSEPLLFGEILIVQARKL